MIEVVTFDPHDNNHLLSEAESYRSHILKTHQQVDASIIDNYVPARFNFLDQRAISLFMHGGVVKGISTLYHRKSFGDAYRCLNRLHFDVNVRTWGRDRDGRDYDCNPRINEVSPLMIEQQSEYLNKGMMFISSEPWKPKWAEMIANNFTNSTTIEWETDRLLYPVCDPAQRGCWQHLIWTGHGDILARGIEREEYERRFNEG